MESDPSSIKITQKHIRVPYSEKPLSYEECELHPGILKELLCSECKTEICINCKLNGHHSTGEEASHSVLSLHDCYSFMVQNKHKKTPQMEKIRGQLAGKITKVSHRLSGVRQDFRALTEQV